MVPQPNAGWIVLRGQQLDAHENMLALSGVWRGTISDNELFIMLVRFNCSGSYSLEKFRAT